MPSRVMPTHLCIHWHPHPAISNSYPWTILSIPYPNFWACDIYIYRLQVSECTQNLFYLTYYVRKQAQRGRTRCWLEWVPHSASTISVLSMTYSTLSLLWGQARVSLGFCLPFFFFFGCPWLSWSTLRQPWNTGGDYWGKTKTRGLQLFFLASRCASSTFLLFGSCANLQISAFTSCLWSIRSCIQLNILFLCSSASSASWAKQIHFCCSLFISATISVVKAVMMASRTGPPRAAQEGNWPGSRKGDWHQNRISPKFGQEFLLP